MLPVIRNVERIAAGLFYFSALMLFAAGFAVIVGGAEAALDSLERKDKASATAPFVFAGLGAEELSASGFFDSSRSFVQNWRQYAARDEIKPELQTPGRIVMEGVKMPLTNDSAPILLLTLRAGNIQTQGGWRVTNAIDAFSINDGELYLTVVNEPATFVATVYLIDNFQMLNEAYQNLTASAVITVEVMPGDLSVKWPSRLEVVAGGVYVFKAHGGFMPHTYTLLENPATNAFAFTNGTLSVNVSAAIEEYRFTVVVSDAVSMAVTAGATVGVSAALSLADAPPFTVIASAAMSLHTFAASGGIGIKTYVLAAGGGGHFAVNAASGVLSLRANAAAGLYMLTAQVMDEHNNTAQAVAMVGVSAVLFLAEVPPLAVPTGVSVNLYTFDAIGGIGDKRYTIVAGNGGGFVLAADSGIIILSQDAAEGVYILSVEASDRASPPGRITVAATINIGDSHIYVLGGYDGNRLNDVWSSADGKSWVLKTDDAGWSVYRALSHNGRLYGLGGNDVWSSADGKSWMRKTNNTGWSERSYQALSHNGRLYVLGGVYTFLEGLIHRNYNYYNDVWSSVDGKNWMRKTNNAGWSGRSSHQALSHNGRLYVLGGRNSNRQGRNNKNLNDVWSSADGKRWVLETDEAGWSGRYSHQALSHNGRLYVLGGEDGSRLNDVWSSADGKNWVRETDDAGWSNRYSHQALSHNGRLYVLGGYYRQNDVWSSADGKNWVRETYSAEWTARTDHQAVVFPSALALFGVGEVITVTVGVSDVNLHTFSAQYGVGDYTYSLALAGRGFTMSPDGVLSMENNAIAGEHTLTVWVKDGRDKRAQTAVRVFVSYFHLTDVPRLVGIAGTKGILHTFTADRDAGQYAIVAGNKEYFSIDADSGALSLMAQAREGVYTLSVEASDNTNSLNKATVAATVELKGKQIFALISSDRLLGSSVDGKNWMWETSHWQLGGIALSHNGRLYVLGGIDGNYENDVRSSADGKNWRWETYNAGWARRDGHQAVSHNGRLYVLGGYVPSGYSNPFRSDVWSSADGENWMLETNNAEWRRREGHQALSHNGRLYVLGGWSGDGPPRSDVWSSVDGKNWRWETYNAGWARRDGHQAVSHNGRLYVLSGNGDDVWSSADGKSWVLEANNAEWFTGGLEYQALSHNGRLYVLGVRADNDKSGVWSSVDGKNWMQEAAWDLYANSDLQAVVFPSALALFGVGEVITVTARASDVNLHTFTAQYGVGDYTYSLNPAVNGFMIDGNSGVLSTDGGATRGHHTLTVWVKDSADNRAQTAVRVFVPYFHLADVPRLFALEGGGIFHTFITDGGISAGQYAIVAGKKEYFAIDADSGDLSLMAQAVEGVYTLYVEASDRENPLNKATVAATVEIKGKRIFVLGGSRGSDELNDVWSSVDGKSWMLETNNAEWSNREYHQALSHNGRFYVLGGYDDYDDLNDVWSSADGKNWILETNNAGWTRRYFHQALSHNGRLYVLGGYDGNRLNDVWSSVDGKNWILETNNAGWARRYSHQALSHNGRLYVLGGYDGNRLNDVWSSVDGKNWTLETNNTRWSRRWGHQALSYNGRLYVLGGGDYGDLNDVWSSVDGKNWTLETNNAEWSRREGHQALSHNGRLYVLGGYGSNRRNDVWSSVDGKNWILETNNAEWSRRSGHQAVVGH